MGNVRNVEREKSRTMETRARTRPAEGVRLASASGIQLRGIIDVVNVILPILKMTVLGRALFFRAREAMFPPEQDQ